MKIVIAGGGVAAFEAANSARKISPDAEITVISSEKILPYRRPALSGMLGDFKINEKAFFIKPENFYAEQRIAVRLNTRCVVISKHSIRWKIPICPLIAMAFCFPVVFRAIT